MTNKFIISDDDNLQIQCHLDRIKAIADAVRMLDMHRELSANQGFAPHTLGNLMSTIDSEISGAGKVLDRVEKLDKVPGGAK